MHALRGIALVVIAMACSGCEGDQTRRLAGACEQLLSQRDPDGIASFIRTAEKRLGELATPPNRLGAYLRDLQDPGAMEYKPALEQCLWRLKSLAR